MVNRENVQTWVDGLLSGDYPQGVGALHLRDDGYCCLGVACEVSGLGRWQDFGQTPGTSKKLKYQVTTEGPLYPAVNLLPIGVRDWLGMTGVSPAVHLDSGELTPLTSLNDRRTPFWEIARLITREWLEDGDSGGREG